MGHGRVGLRTGGEAEIEKAAEMGRRTKGPKDHGLRTTDHGTAAQKAQNQEGTQHSRAATKTEAPILTAETRRTQRGKAATVEDSTADYADGTDCFARIRAIRAIRDQDSYSRSFQGLNVFTPSGAKSRVLRVATVQPCVAAVAAITVSRTAR